jgi:hypothetical protein
MSHRTRRRRWRSDRGSVTAEFAVALPAVLACLALCVGAVSGSAQLGALTAGAAAAARLAGRGDDPAAAPIPGGAGMGVERAGSTVCVRLTAAEDATLSRIGVRLSARACALDEGGAR